jgi:hypothetical protein
MSLTDDDKKWIIEQLGQTESRLSGKIEQVESRLNGRIDQIETRLSGRIEQVETTLLTEFHKWASPFEARMRTHSATLRALDLETEAMDDRLKKLEGGR